MRNIHEPSNEFVEKLGLEIRREAQRRRRSAPVPWWTPRSPVAATVAIVALMLVSMGVGAAAVAASYEAQGKERRDQLTSSYEQRADLARQRLAVATDQLKSVERQVSVGMANNTDVFEGRVKVTEATAQLRSLELQLEEIRLSRLEPRTEVSAPRVSGRDFVGERLRAAMSVPETMLALEQARLKDAQKRFSVGVADGVDVEAARVRVTEAEAALETFGKKLDIRQKFLNGAVDAVETELRVLEAEAEQRTKTLAPKLELARKEVERVTGRVQVGAATRVELSEATLRRLQLETDLTKADLDLTLIRRQIAQHRDGR